MSEVNLVTLEEASQHGLRINNLPSPDFVDLSHLRIDLNRLEAYQKLSGVVSLTISFVDEKDEFETQISGFEGAPGHSLSAKGVAKKTRKQPLDYDPIPAVCKYSSLAMVSLDVASDSITEPLIESGSLNSLNAWRDSFQCEVKKALNSAAKKHLLGVCPVEGLKDALSWSFLIPVTIALTLGPNKVLSLTLLTYLFHELGMKLLVSKVAGNNDRRSLPAHSGVEYGQYLLVRNRIKVWQMVHLVSEGEAPDSKSSLSYSG